MERNKYIQWAILIIVIGIAIFLTFSPGLDGDFLHWDDFENIVENSNIHKLDKDTVKWALNNPHLGVWEPLSFLLKASIIHFWGVDARAFKIVSMILHFINVLLLIYMIKAIMEVTLPDEDNSSMVTLALFLSSLFFALSPMRVSAVTWASCQPYLLCAMFFQLSIILYLKHILKNSNFMLLLSLVAFVLAGLSKAVAMTLPVVLVLLDIYPFGIIQHKTFRRLLSKLPFFMVSLFIAYAAYWARDVFTVFESMGKYNILQRFMICCYGIVFYLKNSLMPFDFSPFYPLPGSRYLPNTEPSVFFSLAFIISALLVILFAVILILRKRFGGLAIMFACYAIILSPNLGITISGVNLVADRYSYIALIPVYILFAHIMLNILKEVIRLANIRKLLAIVLIVFVLIGNIISARAVQEFWQNDKSFWERMIKKYPDCPDGYYIIGSLYASDGYSNKNKKTALIAEQFLVKARELNVQESKVHYKLGFIESELKRFDAAKKSFETYLNQEPYDVLALTRYSDMLLEIEEFEKAEMLLKRAWFADPQKAKIHDVPSKLGKLQSLKLQQKAEPDSIAKN